MQRFANLEPVFSAYPADCQPSQVEAIGSAGGFSGAKLWRLNSPTGKLCLRRWPPEHPDKARLKWIHAVVAHVGNTGCSLLPAPRRTQSGRTFCEYEGYLWELTPWLRGTADFWSDPRPEKLAAAMKALAEFHRAAKTFSLEQPSPRPLDRIASPVTKSLAISPGIIERLTSVRRLLAGGLAELQVALVRNRALMPRVAVQAESLFPLIQPHLSALDRHLRHAANIQVPLQPCLRDIWHDHVLFEGDRVSGIVDTGSMRAETVATDIARLLGSLCANDQERWSIGLAAYKAVFPLGDDERVLIAAFDRSQVLLAGVKWVEWVFVEERTCVDPKAVEKRMEHILKRLQNPPLGSFDGLVIS
jgi:Ser/Thr protein kinase RdoA (MazF antagonist)